MSPIDLMPLSSISSSVTIVRDWGTFIIGVGVLRALTWSDWSTLPFTTTSSISASCAETDPEIKKPHTAIKLKNNTCLIKLALLF